MASEQSQEGQETESISGNNEEDKGSVSSPIEGSKQQSKSSGISSQEQDDDDDDESLSPSIADILPPEMLEGLPPKEKKQIVSSLSIMAMQGSARQSSPLAKQLKPEHITQIIENSEKESQREFEKSKIGENTKRWGMGAILSLVVVVFVYAGVTKDKDLSEKVVLAGISALGGFGAGYAVAKDK
jgi:hypothetical protein